jgi:cell division protein FtsN
MVKGKKGDNYEMVLENRHLLGVFFAVVLLCAVFFTFGFVLGRNQAPAQREVQPSAQKPAPTEAPQAKDLSFYERVEGQPPSDTLPRKQPAAPVAAAQPKAAQAPPSPPPALEPIYLQVAALSQEADAKRLAQELEKLGFPVVLRPPREDRFYRVQVGPFENADLADAAQRRLEAQGFRQVVRR